LAFTRTGYPPPLRYCHAARVSQLMELHMSALPPKETPDTSMYTNNILPPPLAFTPFPPFGIDRRRA